MMFLKALDKDERFFLVNGIIGTAREVCPSFDDLATMEFTPDFLEESVKVPFDTGIFTKRENYLRFQLVGISDRFVEKGKEMYAESSLFTIST